MYVYILNFLNFLINCCKRSFKLAPSLSQVGSSWSQDDSCFLRVQESPTQVATTPMKYFALLPCIIVTSFRLSNVMPSITVSSSIARCIIIQLLQNPPANCQHSKFPFTRIQVNVNDAV